SGHRLTLPRTLHHRRFATAPPSLAMDSVSAKSRFVPEEDVGALTLGATGQRRIDLALPALDGLGVALIGTLQRLLRREPELGQQRADGGDSEAPPKLPPDQQRHNAPRPQSEVEPVLTRIATVDPAKHLALLRRGQGSRPPGRPRRTQRPQSATTSRRSIEPLINHRAVQAERSHHRRRPFPFAHSLHSHPPHFFKRLVIKRASVPLHASFDRYGHALVHKMSSKL